MLKEENIFWRAVLETTALNALLYRRGFSILTNGEKLLQHYTCMHFEIPARNNCLLGEDNAAVVAFSVMNV